MPDWVEPDAAAGVEGEIQVDTDAFDFPGAGVGATLSSARGGVRAAGLCLHGLTGTPYEVRSLGEAIAKVGFRARGPVLPGHNETPERLARVSHTQWLDAARAEFQALKGDCDRVFVIGLSMGGLLALALAEEESVDALVVIGAPLRLRHPAAWGVPIFKYLFPMLRKSQGSDIRDGAARRRQPGYSAMPLHSVHELQRLQRLVAPRLAEINAPILVAHGAHDRTASPQDSLEILGSVSSKVREHLVLESSGHVVPVDFDGRALGSAVAKFLTQQLETA